MGKKINKTTENHFIFFKDKTKKWLTFFGLVDYQVSYFHVDIDCEGNGVTLAMTRRECERSQHVFAIGLAKNWGSIEITEEQLERTAFHEVCEILLNEIRYMAEAEYSYHKVDSEIHRIVRILENTAHKRISEWESMSTKGQVLSRGKGLRIQSR